MRTSQTIIAATATLTLVTLSGCAPNASAPTARTAVGGTADLPPPDNGAARVATPAEIERMEAYIDANRAREVMTTLQLADGDTVDCVPIAAQPALRRPGMEDHKLLLEPRTTALLERLATPPDARLHEKRTAPPATQIYGRAGAVCPPKTVPIAQLTMNTLMRFRTLDDFLRKERYGELADRVPRLDDRRQRPEEGSNDNHQYAVVRRYVDNWGAETIFNLWTPFTEQTDEFSLSQMWVARGSGDNTETVEAGWQSYKSLYGDWNSRLFIYFTPDNYKRGGGGCYNLTCNKFVQVANNVYIGGGFDAYSVHGGDQREFKLLWYKDGPEGAWWLRYGDTWVGYYPRELFDDNGLRVNGARVTFGGEITDDQPGGRHTRTDMGSGHWPPEGFGQTAYQRGVRYVDTSNFYQRATGTSPIVTDANCYDLTKGSSTDDWEEYFFLGGSGFNTFCE